VILILFGGGMATAFKRLRPLFRERGQINAEVTGRLAESLGGVRIVKAYTAEKREEIVFAHGAHRLFRNVAQSLTGVSSITAFSSLVIAAIGIAMMLIGGSAIRAGQMTIGDFFQYFAFTAMITMPVIQLASIGTQLSEAFAGLDRIREIRQMATEDDEDASRASEEPLDVRLCLERASNPLPVNLLVGLSARRPDCRSAASIEQFELNAGGVDRAAHQAAERIDLSNEMTLGGAADGGIARHVGHGICGERAESDVRAKTRGGKGCLTACVAGADDNHIERHLPIQKRAKMCASKSSGVRRPVISSNAARASCKSASTNSSGSDCPSERTAWRARCSAWSARSTSAI
jgi:hypothetical protein